MASKEIKSRIIHKHDIEAIWLKAINFIPMQGELIIYDAEVDSNGNILELPDDRIDPYDYERFKIGDGIKTVSNLPFILDTKASVQLNIWGADD